MFQLVHQCQQAADFSRLTSLARKPVEIVDGQVGDHPALVFAIGHGASEQEFEVKVVHRQRRENCRAIFPVSVAAVLRFPSGNENGGQSGILDCPPALR